MSFDSHGHGVAVPAIHFWGGEVTSTSAPDASQREDGILGKATFTGATTFSLVNLRMRSRQAFTGAQIKQSLM